MLVSDLKAKIIKRGLYYNKWLPVKKFKGLKIICEYYSKEVEFLLIEIERIEP